MPNGMTKILKKQRVRLAGQKQLDGSIVARAQGEVPAARAEIVGEEAGCVIIQVTCGCGQEIQLRCGTGQQPPHRVQAKQAS
jgi:hypothetical protein